MGTFSVQAQTVANFFLAFDQNLAIVPVLNKIDMVSAEPDKVAEEMQQVITHVHRCWCSAPANYTLQLNSYLLVH